MDISIHIQSTSIIIGSSMGGEPPIIYFIPFMTIIPFIGYNRSNYWLVKYIAR